MTVENKWARFMRNTGPARFLIPVGLILIVVGIILIGFNTGNYKKTTGTITDVTPGADDQDQKTYNVSFTYTVDGKELTGKFENISGDYSIDKEITVYYDPNNPEKTTNSKIPGFIAYIVIAAGVAVMIFGIYTAIKAFKKSKALDSSVPPFPVAAFTGFKTASGVTEYYFRYDGNTFKPGYIVEDADRNVLFEGKMLKNALVGARTFEFNDHVNGVVKQHEVGHTTTQSFNDEFFSVKSWFKFDGKNVWDVLHDRGLRMQTNMHSKFPYMIYELAKNGEALARIETSSMYVHEDDEKNHKIVIPTGSHYYRFWTNSKDFDSLFLTIFAISETEQAIVE